MKEQHYPRQDVRPVLGFDDEADALYGHRAELLSAPQNYRRCAN
jgi:hypothetical protein